MFKSFSIGEFHSLAEKMLIVCINLQYCDQSSNPRQNTTTMVKNSKYSKFDEMFDSFEI